MFDYRRIKGGVCMKELLADILVGVGSGAANGASQACAMWYIDEPECPKSLIK